MPPLRSKPRCGKCGGLHWNMVACDKAAARNEQEERNETRRREFIVKRPRDGYRDFGDSLDPDTQRMGQNTFALRRQPGERIGSVRS